MGADNVVETAEAELYMHTVPVEPSPQAKPPANPRGRPRKKVVVNTAGARVQVSLNTPAEVLREMASVYRQMKGGRLDLGTGSKLVWVLGEIRKVQESAVLHERIALLEHQMAQGAPALPEHVDTPDEQAAEDQYLADLVVNEPDAAEPQLVGTGSTLD